MPKSDHGGPPGTRVMTILGFYVSTQIPNIEKFEAYGVYGPREVGQFFSREISRRMPLESWLGTHFRPQL